MSAKQPPPDFYLNRPCSQDQRNLIFNGSMGPEYADTPHGQVVKGWTAIILAGDAPNFRWVDNEGHDPGGSQQIYSESKFDVALYQTVGDLEPGVTYMFRLCYSLAAKSINGPNVRVNSIGRQVGVDPYGGNDPKLPSITWGPVLWDGKAALHCPEMNMFFVAQTAKATIYLRANATDDSEGENRVWFDQVCMEARPEIAKVAIVAQPQPKPAQPASGLESAVSARANQEKWMPVNNQGALWKFAKSNNLQDQQTDELEFTFNGEKYVCQVFNLGIVYCKVGDWGNIQVVKK